VIDSKLRIAAPNPTDHPVDIGQRSEAAIRLALLTRGYCYSIPEGVNQRYDLILDIDGRLLKAQCKTGRLRDGVIRFPARSTRSSRSGIFFRDYAGDADLFLVYCPETEGIYAVPVDDAPRCGMHLRVDETRNGQAQRVNWASEYELPG
jgi:PD-(D/E)XK endonuclease